MVRGGGRGGRVGGGERRKEWRVGREKIILFSPLSTRNMHC